MNAPPDARSTSSGTQSVRRGRTGVLLFLGLFALYLANGKVSQHLQSGDTIPNRLLPFSLLRFGTITADPFRETIARHGGFRWYLQDRPVGLVSFYPIGTPIVALPFFIPIYAGLVTAERTSAEELFLASPYVEKIVAAGMTASAVVLVWSCLRRRVTERKALSISVVLGACTLLWPVASQLLWQHTAASLLIALGCLILCLGPGWRRSVALGMTFGLLFAVRPQAAVFLVALPLGLLLEPGTAKSRFSGTLWYCLGALPSIVGTLAYNQWSYGLWGGGYQFFASRLFGLEYVLPGIAGLTLSPNRGALVLMPVVIFGIIGAGRALRRWRSEPAVAALVMAAGGYFLIHAATRSWAGGWCFGPRYLTELLPLMAVCAAQLEWRPGARMALLIAAIAWSFVMQLAGAVFYPASRWNARMQAETLEEKAWDWSHFMPWEDFQSWLQQRAAAATAPPTNPR